MSKGRVFKTEMRARYAETDASGIVYYNSYFVYFEVGRMEMFRELGLEYNWRLPIVDTRCRYRASARFDDLLQVHSYIAEIRRCGYRIGHEVFRVEPNGEPTLLVEGHTAMVTVDDSGKAAPLPADFAVAFNACLTRGDRP